MLLLGTNKVILTKDYFYFKTLYFTIYNQWEPPKHNRL